MKKLLVLLALCMIISVVLVACDTPDEPVVDETTAGATEAPTTEETTEAPTTEETTEAPTTEETTEAPTTEETTTEETTEPPVVIDPVKVGQSFDECDMWIDGQPVGAFFTPGQAKNWDGNAVVEDYNVQAIRVWGWVAFFAETPGTFGYQIGDAEPVFDEGFSVDAEQGVLDVAVAQGGKSAARMKIFVPVEYLSGEEIVIKALVKDAVGTVETICEFKLSKPVNPNAPVVFLNASDMAATIPGSPDIVSAEMSADGNYITINTANISGDAFHDPYYQLPMLNGKGTVANFVVIKYRTTVAGARSEVFIGSGAGPNGQGDNFAFDVETDGKWHLAVIDLSNLSAVVDGVINYLRWDPYVGSAETASIDMGYIAAFQSAEAAIAWDAQFADKFIDIYNVPQDIWAVSGHKTGVTPSDDASHGGMVAAGGIASGALLHQGSVGIGELNLAQFSKMIIYYGVDNSQVTLDHWAASANNRFMITSADTHLTNSPAEETIVASVDYQPTGWALTAIEIDLTGVDYNGPVFVSYDTLPGTFMLIGAIELVYDNNYVEPAEPIIGSADFDTIVTTNEFGDSSYNNTYTTAAGWTTVNSAIQAGGTKNSNPQFTVIGDNSGIKAVCLNGKTTAIGKLTSPTLTGGLSKITLTYTKMFTDTVLSVTVIVTDVTTGEKYEHVVARDVDKDNDKYVVWTDEWVLETAISGDYTIEVVNNCPSQSTSNKDRITILSLVYEN